MIREKHYIKKTINESNLLNLKKNIKINYSYYSNIITNFKKDYILALDAKLVLKMNISYDSFFNEDFNKIKADEVLTIEIPLSEQTISINANKIMNSNSTMYVKNDDDSNNRKILLGFLLTIDILIIINIIIRIIELKPLKREFQKKLSKILKEYDRALVTVKKMPNIDNLKVIQIDNFEEILDCRDNLEKPILFYKFANKDKAVFTIIHEKEAYIYVLDANSIEEKYEKKSK